MKDSIPQPQPVPSLAERIVDAIIADLTSRAGFDSEWDMIDLDTQDEIHDAWQQIVTDELRA